MLSGAQLERCDILCLLLLLRLLLPHLHHLLCFQVPSWRAVTFLAALPCILYPVLLPSMYESPSWLLTVGRKVLTLL